MGRKDIFMGKIQRGRRVMWLKFGEDITVLGKDSDDLSIDLNNDNESFKNVLGETTFRNNGYTPSMSYEYSAREEDAIYPHIQEIADTLATDDERTGAELIVATLNLEYKEIGAGTANGKGFKVPVKVTVDNDGGSTDGYSIPFTITEDGARVQGTVSVENKVPTFTAGGASGASVFSAKSTEGEGKDSKLS